MNRKTGQSSSFIREIRQCLCDVVYGLFRAMLMVLFRIFFRVRVVGREHCPQDGGPLLVVCNHLSEWDPPFLGTCLPWQVHWLAKIELFELLGGGTSGFFRMLHCIHVDRKKTDLGAVKEVVRLLNGKRPVVVFAEGGTCTDEHSVLGHSPELKEGAASMAILADCPILLVVLNGTTALYQLRNWFFFRRCLLEVVIGPVFRLETRDRAEATRQILTRMLELKSSLQQQKVC